MSGLEVAGLVLGTLPIAIKGVKAYIDMMSSVKSVKRDLKHMLRDLETEKVLMENTCEALLVGVVPTSMIDKMIEAPFGPEWKQYDERLRLRLWRSCNQFEEQVSDMMKSIEDLREKLCLHPDGQVKLGNRSRILQEMKQNASFSLRKQDYDRLLARIKDGNSALQSLSQQNHNLEPNRRVRSQARIIQLVRRLTQNIFTAIRDAMTCSCVQPHSVGLELTPRSAVLVPGDHDDRVAEKLNFNIILGSMLQPEASVGALAIRHGPSLMQLVGWENLLVRLISHKKDAPSPSCPIQMDAVENTPRRVKWASSISFRMGKKTTMSSTETLVAETKRLSVLPNTPNLSSSRILDLCQAVHRFDPITNCCGHVIHAEQTFGIYSHQPGSSICSSYSLRSVIDRTELDIPPFIFPERLKVALALSISVLHLYNTPWLASTVTLDDVIFLNEGKSSHVSSYKPYRPFISKGPQSSESPISSNVQLAQRSGIVRPINLTVLSLATILIQVIIGEPIEVLDITENMDLNMVLDKHQAASRLINRAVQSGGINYGYAVEWCLNSILNIAGLEDENFCQRFYEAVVARLEEDVRVLER